MTQNASRGGHKCFQGEQNTSKGDKTLPELQGQECLGSSEHRDALPFTASVSTSHPGWGSNWMKVLVFIDVHLLSGWGSEGQLITESENPMNFWRTANYESVQIDERKSAYYELEKSVNIWRPFNNKPNNSTEGLKISELWNCISAWKYNWAFTHLRQKCRVLELPIIPERRYEC